VPLFTYGKSASYAWGCTALNPDNTDLYVEKIEGNKYLFDGEWHELKTVRETFKVRLGGEVAFDYKFTHNGVLLHKPSKDELGFSIWFPLEFLNQNNDLNYSLRWIYSDDVPTKVYSISKELFQSKPSLARMEKFLENQNIFPLNMNFVTKDGHIGYHMTGLFPKRKYNVG
jgi:penicillin amidase